MAGDRDESSEGKRWLGEHRLQAVLEVRSGSPVAEVAARYGASRQSVYGWKARYERDGAAELADRSRRPLTSPQRMAAEVETLLCELAWSCRRSSGTGASTGAGRGKHRCICGQTDLVGGIFLAGGRECKMVTGIDDYSRYVVIAQVPH